MMDTTEILYTTTAAANAMKNALSTEMLLTPTLHLQQQQTQQQEQSPQLSPIAPIPTTTHTPREIPSMYILDQMYDDYMDQYNGNNITTPTEVPETNASVELAPCPICSRTFNPSTLRKHVGICEKMTMKKRNIFDSSRQRREGTDLATYPLPKNFGLPEKTTSSTSITQARNDRGQSPKPTVQQVCSPIMARKKLSEDLIRSTARASMRKAVATNSSTTLTGASTPSSNFNRDRMRSSERSLTRRGIQPPPAEQCPHCDRCFGIKAYDRHVEWCKEKALLASIKHGSSKNEGNVAKARLEARTKYRAPCFKTKRSINREKYSGLAGEEPETEDTSKCSKTNLNKTQDNSLMSMSMTSSICSERKIKNSPTGNINKQVKTKINKSSNFSIENRKCLRDKIQTPQPPTMAYTVAASKEDGEVEKEEELQNGEPIINLEIEIPEFYLMGEQMAATSINKKQQQQKVATIKTKVDTVTAAKIKPLKQKQKQQQQQKQQQRQPTECEKVLQINSKKSYQQRKTTDVQINLMLSPSPSPSTPAPKTILAQPKSTSDLSLKSLHRDKFVLEIDKDNYHYDNDDYVFDFEEVQFEANKAPIEKKSKEMISNTKPITVEEEYFDKQENPAFNAKLKTAQREEPILNHNLELPRQTPEELCNAREIQNQDLIMKTLNTEQQNDLENFCNSQKEEFTKADVPHKRKSKSIRKSRTLTTQTACTKVLRSAKDFSTPRDCLSETEIYKDCLPDSDELKHRKLTRKGAVTGETTAEGNLKKELQSIESSSKSDATENSYNLIEFVDNNDNNLHYCQPVMNTKSQVDLNSLQTIQSHISSAANKEKINKTSPCNETPQRSLQLSPPPHSFTSINAAIKTEISSRLKSLKMCQPKRKKVLRQTESCTNAFPMKALMLPLSMENLQICGVYSAPQINSNRRKGGVEIEEIKYKKYKKCSDIVVDNEKTNTCVLNKEIKVIKEPPPPLPQQLLKRNRSFTIIGLPDNYDPFLSAKRQLEELCSPSADTVDVPTAPQTPQLPSIPVTPNINNKMTTSLILSSSTPNTTPNQMTTSHMSHQTQKTPILARSSSFRRTSSLRGPRRSPMLTSRPPLFAQKHRPTIQRGLSDEGPISTNFLKPEEYDEMPVRSVCVNDFAVNNKSPRVVRRDTSNSNRKQPLKLNINVANAGSNTSATVSPNIIELDDGGNNTVSKYVSKTDSLAVFLKFEHELEKLSNTAADSEHKSPTSAAANSPPVTNLDGPLNAKELKDKSNNLSKQNSAKNITSKTDISATNDGTENYDNNLNTTEHLNTNDVEAVKYGHVRLAPLASKPSTPSTLLMKSSSLQVVHPPSTPQLTALIVKNSLTLNPEEKQHNKTPKPVALSSIFSSDNKTTKQTSLLYTERKNSLSSDYIDPKLINKCDNLPINLNIKRTEFKLSDTDASEIRLEHFSSSSSESSAPAKKSAVTSQPQQAKFLPSVKQEQQQQMQLPTQQQHKPQHEQNINLNQNHQRNSAEGRNLLKRRMRLGRNQFLYDASPEGDSCSADDEGANRSSMEGDAAQQHYNSVREREKAFERLSSVQINPIDAPFIPPLPAFDDFDFEEFLSSFENDEEQFPLFKDCREFLMNRTSKKQRSMLMPNSATQNINNSYNNINNNTTNFKKSPSPQTFPPLTPQSHHSMAGQHFQFPTLTQHPKNVFNPFSLNTRARNKYDELTAIKSTDTFTIDNHTEEYRELDSQSLDKKREIFISIETEQNDLDKSSISPNSIRNMVGNPQTVVEVEVDAAHDNKFSKISDDDDDVDASQNSNCRSKNFAAKHLPNVQLNNAKNLMQQMQEDFRHASEDFSGNLRMTTIEHRTGPVDMNMNTNSCISGNKRNMKNNMNRGDAYGDSDELSSLDGYPLSSPNSRLGVSSKTSADSAYGSLSRQRSSELTAQRSSSRNRPLTSNTTNNTLLNRPLTEETSLGRSRQLSASSSSSSERALPPITNSSSFHKQQHLCTNNNSASTKNNNNIAKDLDDLMRYEVHNNNTNNYDLQQLPHSNLTGATNSHSNLESLQQYTTSNSTMSTSMKMSKFCHECGSKFLLEQAKFCMDCGVKRIVL